MLTLLLGLFRLPQQSEVIHPLPRVLLWRERCVHGMLALCAAIPTLGIVAIFTVFVYQTGLFFQHVSLWEVLSHREWTPMFATQQFGIVTLVSATLLVTAIALAVAVPLGTMAAIYLSEYAAPTIRRAIKPVLGALAGIPTIVYGYFALQFVTPSLRHAVGGLPAFNALSAGLMTGVLIMPTITSISEDAIHDVPQFLREGAYATGLNRHEAIFHIVLPAAMPGIVASYTLAAARALGETMIAAIAAGQNPTLTLNPLVPVETMTGFIVQVSLGDVPTGTLIFHTIFAVGLMLFLITLGLNHLGQLMVRRYSASMRNMEIPKAEIKRGRLSGNGAARFKWISKVDYGQFAEQTSGSEQSRPFPLLHAADFRPNFAQRIWTNRAIAILGALASLLGVAMFLLLVLGTFQNGWSRLDWAFITSYTSRDPDGAGVFPALVGTLMLLITSAIISVPIGISTALYLEEYLTNNILNRWIELSISNAAAVPSILYGLLGLALFVRRFAPITGGRSLLSASLVMAMIAVPIIIIAAQTALRSLPDDLRQAAYAVGMTRSQVVWHVILPHAFPGIVTAVLLALSRVLGETAALLAIGAAVFVNFVPPLALEGLTSPFTTLPTQTFFWILRPQQEFQQNAAAAILLLGGLVLVMNTVAVLVRDLFRRRA